MKKKFITQIIVAFLVIGLLSGCGSSSQENIETAVQAEEAAEEAEAAAKAEEEAVVKAAEEEAAAKAAEEEAAKQEEADTSYEAGRACLYGLDEKEIDLEAAYNNFENALELGKTEANFYLGLLYDWYSYPEQDFEKARTYYEAAGDDPYAQLALGILYHNGQGVEADTAKGEELFEASIAQGCVEGYLGSASIAYDNEDYDTAFEYYNKVLEGKEQAFITSAMDHLGYMYFSGTGVEQNYAKALEWYEKSADSGDTWAMNEIGAAYFNGTGVEQDYNKALEWYEKAADLGSDAAMNEIGAMYDYGIGVEQDYAKALEWYEKAADLGSNAAMNNIGVLYFNGTGVEQDYIKALEWFEKSADLGNSAAMGNLGYMYEHGKGVEQDSAKAEEWNRKAEAAEE